MNTKPTQEKMTIPAVFYGKWLKANSKVQVLSIDEENNKLNVKVVTGNDWFFDQWNLEHTRWGFKGNEYSTKPYTK